MRRRVGALSMPTNRSSFAISYEFLLYLVCSNSYYFHLFVDDISNWLNGSLSSFVGAVGIILHIYSCAFYRFIVVNVIQ